MFSFVNREGERERKTEREREREKEKQYSIHLPFYALSLYVCRHTLVLARI